MKLERGRCRGTPRRGRDPANPLTTASPPPRNIHVAAAAGPRPAPTDYPLPQESAPTGFVSAPRDGELSAGREQACEIVRGAGRGTAADAAWIVRGAVAGSRGDEERKRRRLVERAARAAAATRLRGISTWRPAAAPRPVHDPRSPARPPGAGSSERRRRRAVRLLLEELLDVRRGFLLAVVVVQRHRRDLDGLLEDVLLHRRRLDHRAGARHVLRAGADRRGGCSCSSAPLGTAARRPLDDRLRLRRQNWGSHSAGNFGSCNPPRPRSIWTGYLLAPLKHADVLLHRIPARIDSDFPSDQRYARRCGALATTVRCQGHALPV